MVRFYKGVTEQILMGIDYIRQQGISMKDLRGRIGRQQEERVSSRAGLMESRLYLSYNDHFNRYDPSIISTDEVMETILDQLEHERKLEGKDGGGDLIDFIVATLQLPFARNVLGGKTLEVLKKGILLPKEIGGSRLLLQREMTCPGCNHTFQSGETTTIHRSGGEVTLYCTKCVKPSLMRCEKCENGVMPMNPGVFNKASKEGCGCSGEGKKKKLAIDSIEPEPEREGGARAGRARGGPLPTFRRMEGGTFIPRPRGNPIIEGGEGPAPARARERFFRNTPDGRVVETDRMGVDITAPTPIVPQPPPPQGAQEGPQATTQAATSLWGMMNDDQLNMQNLASEAERRRMAAADIYRRMTTRVRLDQAAAADRVAAALDAPTPTQPPEEEDR